MSQNPTVVALLLWVASTGFLFSQTTPEWGAQATSTSTVGADDFQPYDPALALLMANGFGANRKSTSVVGGDYDAAVHLPSGALVTGLRLVACPLINNVDANIYECDVATCSLKGSVSAIPGCATTSQPITPAFAIDNGTKTYMVSVSPQRRVCLHRC